MINNKPRHKMKPSSGYNLIRLNKVRVKCWNERKSQTQTTLTEPRKSTLKIKKQTITISEFHFVHSLWIYCLIIPIYFGSFFSSSYKNWIKFFIFIIHYSFRAAHFYGNFSAFKLLNNLFFMCFVFFSSVSFLFHSLHEMRCAKCAPAMSGVVGGLWGISSESNNKMCPFQRGLCIWIMVFMWWLRFQPFYFAHSTCRLQCNAVPWISLHVYVMIKKSIETTNKWTNK